MELFETKFIHQKLHIFQTNTDHSKIRRHRYIDQLLPVPKFVFLVFYIDPDKSGYPHNIILISPQKICRWYSSDAPWPGASNEYPQHVFFPWRKNNQEASKIKKVSDGEKRKKKKMHFFHYFNKGS